MSYEQKVAEQQNKKEFIEMVSISVETEKNDIGWGFWTVKNNFVSSIVKTLCLTGIESMHGIS